MKQELIYNCDSKNKNLINNDYTVKQRDGKWISGQNRIAQINQHSRAQVVSTESSKRPRWFLYTNHKHVVQTQTSWHLTSATPQVLSRAQQNTTGNMAQYLLYSSFFQFCCIAPRIDRFHMTSSFSKIEN